DVDHFKSVNDTYGHAMGDEVLKAVASTLQEHARPSDLVCRFGGEEFCLLLPATDLEGAKALAENYRVAIMSLEFEKLSVTASLGCSTFSDDSRSEGRADTFEVMQEQADQCLYHAKRHGRNQVVGYDQVLAAARGEADQRSSSESDSETELSPEKALLRSIQQLMSEARDAGNSEVAVDQLNEAIARV
ncbi:MAG: GGDEF domain-containing protein, partial [Planctomycetota bacterium]